MKKSLSLILLITPIILLITGCNKTDNLKGTWIAKPKDQSVYIVDYIDGKKVTRGGKSSYYLTLDGKGNYQLEMGNYNEKGTYVLKEKNITFIKEDNTISETCKVKNNELHCSKYATLYSKEK